MALLHFLLHPITILILLQGNSIIIMGHDLIPLEAPTNVSLHRTAIEPNEIDVTWDPVTIESVRGELRGYLIRVWNHLGTQEYARPFDVNRASIEFEPFAQNFITVSVRNDRYVGPPSTAIKFDAPQIKPNFPDGLTAYQLSNRSIFLRWKKPTKPNGILLGYKIYRIKSIDSYMEPDDHGLVLHIKDPDKLQAKLTGLDVEEQYEIRITAINCAGEGMRHKIKFTLKPMHKANEPFPSDFTYKFNYRETNGDIDCMLLPTPLSLSSSSPPPSAPVTNLLRDNIAETSSSSSSLFLPSSKEDDGNVNDDNPLLSDDYYYDYILEKNDAATTTQFNSTISSSSTTTTTIINVSEKNDNGYETSTTVSTTTAITNTNRCLVNLFILWLPDYGNNAGESFYVKYRLKGGGGDGDKNTFRKIKPRNNTDDFVILSDFDACKSYELIVTAVDGDFSTDSAMKTTPITVFP